MKKNNFKKYIIGALITVIVINASAINTFAHTFKNLGYFSSDNTYNTSFSSTDSINALVLMIDFKDMRNTNANMTPGNLYNHYFYNDATATNPSGSLSNYYNKSSNGKFDIAGEVFNWYTAPNNRDYYKSSDLIEELIIDTIAFNINNNKLDINNFDSDENGIVDAIYVQYAGGYDTTGEYFSDYTTDFKKYNNVTFNDIKLQNYVMLGSTKLSKIIHETGHLLGIPDYYYKSDINNQNMYGLGGLDMMDGAVGDHNAFTKLTLNWANPMQVNENDYNNVIKLDMSTKNNDCVIIPAVDKKTGLQIYYILEYLLPTGVWEFDLAVNNIYHGGLRVLKVSPTLVADKNEFLFSNNDLVSLITPIKQNSLLSTDHLFFEGSVTLPSLDGDIYINNIKLRNNSVLFEVSK